MRVVSLSVVLVAFSASASAQNLTPPQASFVPSVAEADHQVNIPVKTATGATILVPLKLALAKQEKGSNALRTQNFVHAVLPSWTLVPFVDASQQIVFSLRPTQLWTTD
jgi:hypothetical protein